MSQPSFFRGDSSPSPVDRTSSKSAAGPVVTRFFAPLEHSRHVNVANHDTLILEIVFEIVTKIAFRKFFKFG